MDIDLVELRQITMRLFDHLIEDRKIAKVPLEENFYWTVPTDNLYRVASAPEELNVGSLHDDWGFISPLLSAETSPIAYQLTELSPLLSYIGHKLSAELADQGG